MTNLRLLFGLAFAPLVACAGDPNDVVVQLAPEVISSIDGTLSVHALVLVNNDPASKDKAVSLTVAYTDRNGTAHTVAPVDGKTDERGALDAKFTGLTWDGTGSVTATAGAATGEATFAVLDRTPPKLTIIPPANNQVRVNMTTTVNVHVTDEIGVSEVYLESSSNGGNGNRQRSTIVASGSTDVMVPFDYQFNDTQVGQMVTLYALASDLSGNQAAAPSITVMVVP